MTFEEKLTGVDIAEVSARTGIAIERLRTSMDDMDACEFLTLCKLLKLDPLTFYEESAGQASTDIV